MHAAVAEHDAIDLVWSSPEAKLWVASLNGEYAGMVEFTDGHFVALDRTGRNHGGFSSLPLAQALLSRIARAEAATPAPVSLPYVAAVVGTVALSITTMTIAAVAA